VRISKKVAEIWLKLFKKNEIYVTILDNNVKYNYFIERQLHNIWIDLSLLCHVILALRQ